VLRISQNFDAFTYAMLVSIDNDMVTTWHLCGSQCGVVVKLMLGKMLINIKSKLKPTF
jgi:hypothetical protein